MICVDLLKGDHFMTRNYDHYNYDKSKESKYSFNMNINLQPAFWSQTLGGQTFGSSDADWIPSSNKITIYYQMGNTYSFIVPKSFSVKSIIFDALDSSLLPSEACLQYNSRWWTISGTQMTRNPSNTSPPTSWSIQTIQTEEWKSTFGNSFFQFAYSDTLSNINGVGTLTIDSWTFQNFFYDFTSFIGLINGHGKISITGSTFDRFSNWGSIIRDTRELPNLDYTKPTTASMIVSYRDSMNSINVLQNKYYVMPTSWANPSWASILIQTSTFTNFNYMKSGGKTYHKVSSTSKMMNQGIILNLNNFYGNIVLKSNTFSGLKFKYKNWEEIYNTGTQFDQDNIWGEPKILQAKALIYINVNSGQLEIYGNTFTGWNSLMGLIYLQRSSNYKTSILIHQNTFTKNSAMLGANAINIYLWTNVGYTSIFSSADMICAGVQISSNTFTQNVGWFNTIGTIQSVCYTDGLDTPLAQGTQYSTPKSMSKNKSDNKSTSGIKSFTTVNSVTMLSSSIQVDQNKFQFKQNTFNENYAGAKASIVQLTNIRRIHIDSDTYTLNS